ncbi:TetR/AcrR family transcriptional regulator [Clostridium sp. 'deep sea']|uniref:TetR/AcrR family transcriptional regulator n=1 Tax=Clostridium sp. 'deep sea' TaxID=2779445 RepID=UPI00189683BE|nr:TetR/AcrR family transcriptional regulator [Clostridium sp. 'deep sea']QOR36726.1 TetR/AcrR family transcriptional regulator [Clostridium sp. 'deep sea']
MKTSTRELLLESVHKTLLLNGSNKTTIKEIAKNAGVNHGLVHHYFSSKEDLFIAVLIYKNGAFCESINNISENEDIEKVLSKFIIPNLMLLIEFTNLANSMPKLQVELGNRLNITRNVIGKHYNIKCVEKQKVLLASLLGFLVHSRIDHNLSLNDYVRNLVSLLNR